MFQIVGCVTAVLGMTGGFIALENHWVNYPFHKSSIEVVEKKLDYDLAQVANTIERIQQNSMIKNAQDEMFFWMKIEMQMKEVKARYGGKSPSKEFDVKLNEAVDNRVKAEGKLNQLQEQFRKGEGK